MIQLTHFMMVPFTGLGLHNGFRGNRWLKNRLAVFNQFVLPSLLNQEEKGFYVWFCWRYEEKTNPLVENFIESLNKIHDFHHVHTFYGIPFWDDKYEDEEARRRLINTLMLSLPELKNYVSEATHVALTIQPSDDLYTSRATKQIRGRILEEIPRRSGTFAVGFREGYIMNYATKEIAEYAKVDWTTDHLSSYRTNTIPPFFTIVFNTDKFLDVWKHYDEIGPYKSHEYIDQHMPYIPLEGRGFCVGTHGANISTVWNHRYKGRVLEGEERDKTLINFGVYFSDPVVIRDGARVLARKVLNVLPYNNTLRNYYHKLPPCLQKL